MPCFVHETARVDEGSAIGAETKVWHFSHIMKGARIGERCILGQNVNVDGGAVIGNHVKIQNNVSVFHGVTIEDGVFVGPHVCFTNDRHPRAINPDGELKSGEDWTLGLTLVRYGASLGAGSTICCGVTIGRWALVGAGSVVTRDVPDNGLVWGNPARLRGFVCPCGHRLEAETKPPSGTTGVQLRCPKCQSRIEVPAHLYRQAGGSS